MARPIEWLLRIPRAIAAAKLLQEEMITSVMLASLLEIGLRQATRVMIRFGAFRSAGRYWLPRDEVIAKLELLECGEDLNQAVARRLKLAGSLELAKRAISGRLVRLDPKPVEDSSKGVLLARVIVTGDKMEVAYTDAVDLLTQLMELAQAAASDFDTFKTKVETLSVRQKVGKERTDGIDEPQSIAE